MKKTKKIKKIPKFLQGVLWSVKVEHLDLEKDRVYIINQVLACGAWRHLQWLYQVYPERVIRDTFVRQPIKIYYPITFNFCKEILFNLKDKNLRQENYDRNLPRHLGS